MHLISKIVIAVHCHEPVTTNDLVDRLASLEGYSRRQVRDALRLNGPRHGLIHTPLGWTTRKKMTLDELKNECFRLSSVLSNWATGGFLLKATSCKENEQMLDLIQNTLAYIDGLIRKVKQ